MIKTFKRQSTSDVIFNTCNLIFMIFIVMVTLYPFVNTIAVSLNDGMDTVRGGIFLFPRELTIANYKAVFADGHIYHAFYISVMRTVIGTVLQVFFTAMLAYALSRKEYIFNKPITAAFVLTMYFSGGLIPGYLLIKSLGLLNQFAVYIIPGLLSAFNMIVVRTYMNGIPDSLVESARIDGAGEFRIFIRIMLPLATPVLATIALFVAVGQWNSWFDTMLFASSKQNLSTMQYELMKLLSAASASNVDPNRSAETAGKVNTMITPASMRAAVTIVAAAPIILVYPFLQKHFVTGLTIGGVKE